MSKNKTNKKEELIIETPETETPAAEEAAQAPVGETELLAQAEAQRDEYLDALLRERANFENYKRRNAQGGGKSQDGREARNGGEIPAGDGQYGTRAVGGERGFPPREGIEKIQKQLSGLFSEMGIEEIKAEGQPFDPNLHNAVMQVDPEGEEQSGTVRSVLQKGYRTKEQVLRHSMVMVVK
ncbi:MAG: nucleotide exchange factor GrpE [Christensenellaceae bacterium]